MPPPSAPHTPRGVRPTSPPPTPPPATRPPSSPRTCRRPTSSRSRSYAALIRPNHAVSDALKTGLGLRVPDTSPSPIPPPTSNPVLTIKSRGQRRAAAPRRRPVHAHAAGPPRGGQRPPALPRGGHDPRQPPRAAPFLSLVTRAGYQSTFDGGTTARPSRTLPAGPTARASWGRGARACR